MGLAKSRSATGPRRSQRYISLVPLCPVADVICADAVLAIAVRKASA